MERYDFLGFQDEPPTESPDGEWVRYDDLPEMDAVVRVGDRMNFNMRLFNDLRRDFGDETVLLRVIEVVVHSDGTKQIWLSKD